MPIFVVVTAIAAPIERCFDLSRSIDFHIDSLAHTGERAVAGVTSGLIGLGEEVTWSARHLGIRWRATARIVVFDRPRHFRDEMVRGPFRRFAHDHSFTVVDGVTEMRDSVEVASPLGPLGRIADALLIRRYMRRLIVARAQRLKQAAESSSWQGFV